MKIFCKTAEDNFAHLFGTSEKKVEIVKIENINFESGIHLACAQIYLL